MVKGRVINPSDESGMGEIDYSLRTMFAARETEKIRDRTMTGRRRLAGWEHGGNAVSPSLVGAGILRDKCAVAQQCLDPRPLAS